MEDEATRVLREGERRLCPRPDGVRRASLPLARLRLARQRLGLYVYEQSRVSERFLLATRSAPSLRARLEPPSGSKWSFESAVGHRDSVFLKAVDSTGYDHLLCMLQPSSAKLRWQRRAGMRLVDVAYVQGALLAQWYEPSGPRHVVEYLNPESGEVQASFELAQPCYRRPFFSSPSGLLLVTQPEEPGSVLAWLDEARAIAMGPDGPREARRLETPSLALAASLHCIPSRAPIELMQLVFPDAVAIRQVFLHHGRERLMLVALTRELSVRLVQLRPAMEEAGLERVIDGVGRAPRGVAYIPRFTPFGGGELGVMSVFDTRIPGAPPPGKELAVACPYVWFLGEDGKLEMLPLGHAGASTALLAGGIWMQLRDAPPRLSVYTVSQGQLMSLYQLPVAALVASPGTAAPWQLRESALSHSVLPFGPYLLTLEQQRLCIREAELEED
ncbi:MAG: hypothetical protein RBU37_06035 [Myxococcota bacterium]|jgi:hypothetical protein|nr:hypothetical protein [Myxococcota bacterium]